MTQIEIIQTLEFTKMELETCYKRLGYTSSNVLKALDETIEALSKADVIRSLPLTKVNKEKKCCSGRTDGYRCADCGNAV